MEFDSYFLTSYLHKNFLILPAEVTLSKNLRTDFGLSTADMNEMFAYLEEMFDMKFPQKNAPDRYEYVIDLIFYIILHDHYKAFNKKILQV